MFLKRHLWIFTFYDPQSNGCHLEASFPPRHRLPGFHQRSVSSANDGTSSRHKSHKTIPTTWLSIRGPRTSSGLLLRRRRDSHPNHTQNCVSRSEDPPEVPVQPLSGESEALFRAGGLHRLFVSRIHAAQYASSRSRPHVSVMERNRRRLGVVRTIFSYQRLRRDGGRTAETDVWEGPEEWLVG